MKKKEVKQELILLKKVEHSFGFPRKTQPKVNQNKLKKTCAQK